MVVVVVVVEMVPRPLVEISARANADVGAIARTKTVRVARAVMDPTD
jgi:hypothetical protein